MSGIQTWVYRALNTWVTHDFFKPANPGLCYPGTLVCGFLHMTVVPAGITQSAYYLWEFCLSVRPSIRLSWCHDPVLNQAQVR